MKIKITDEDTKEVKEVDSIDLMERIVYGVKDSKRNYVLEFVILIVILVLVIAPFFIIK